MTLELQEDSLAPYAHIAVSSDMAVWADHIVHADIPSVQYFQCYKVTNQRRGILYISTRYIPHDKAVNFSVVKWNTRPYRYLYIKSEQAFSVVSTKLYIITQRIAALATQFKEEWADDAVSPDKVVDLIEAILLEDPTWTDYQRFGSL